jgi:hypothetical protein
MGLANLWRRRSPGRECHGRERGAKIFCVGFNKTGTTSLGAALQAFGFRLGDQVEAESYMDDWARRNFRRLKRYCESADAFQDVPFSLDYTYVALDDEFPGSKFILTVRNNADEWFESLVRFHEQLIGRGRTPTAQDLQEFGYGGGDGWFWRAHTQIFDVDERTLYDRAHYIRSYHCHNEQVRNYFRNRRQDLLVLNLGDPGAISALGDFLGVDATTVNMPHLNKSAA